MSDSKPFRISAAATMLLSATCGLLGASVACGNSSTDADVVNDTQNDISADAVAPKDATPNADAGAALGPPRVYVGSGDGKIRLYSFDLKTYALTLIDAIDTGKAPSFLAFDPDRHFAY